MEPAIFKRNYDQKLWSAGIVALGVTKGFLTPEEFTEITGYTYQDPNAALDAAAAQVDATIGNDL